MTSPTDKEAFLEGFAKGFHLGMKRENSECTSRQAMALMWEECKKWEDEQS